MCIACEEMLADALDQTLAEADQTWFDRHVDSCMDCSQMVADAQRGAAWLEMLKTPRPEPSASLLERIIAQTSDQTSGQTSGQQAGSHATDPIQAPVVLGQPAVLPGSVPVAPANVLAFRPRLQRFAARLGSGFGSGGSFEPRLAMTAAMAFFSIALTLNLAGVRLDQLRAHDLSPNKVKQSYYEASAEAVRYYDNLRVVRVVESRVEQVESQNLKGQENGQDNGQPAQTAPPASAAPKQEIPKENKERKNGQRPGGTSRSESPFLRPRFQQVADRGSKSEEGGVA